MYEFHYHYVKNKYDKSSILSGTDSLMYEIKTEDFYEDFSKNKETCYFSNYSSKSKRQKNLWLVKRKMKHLVFQLKNWLN